MQACQATHLLLLGNILAEGRIIQQGCTLQEELIQRCNI